MSAMSNSRLTGMFKYNRLAGQESITHDFQPSVQFNALHSTAVIHQSSVKTEQLHTLHPVKSNIQPITGY